ncbi:SWIM zinc finger protein [Xylariales sp. AK1849]|nr:SWIM zinc finger protein [Xylariales sp. AK1849]
MGAQPDTQKTEDLVTPSSSKKRKLPAAGPAGSHMPSFPNVASTFTEVDSGSGLMNEAIPDEKPKKSRKKNDGGEEKRRRRFRPKAPQNFQEIYGRATFQRFYVLSRSRCGTAQCPEETVDITGSTGNIYQVHIAQLPRCNCPHARAGNQCKHVLYVMSRVLRARFDLVYQLALLSTELVEIFDSAPPIEVGDDAEKPKDDKNRKVIEGDCPICFMPFEDSDTTVYCRATCGQNIHKECFEMWAATKRQDRNGRDQVTCPMCRTPWQGDDDMVKKIKNTGVVGREGYVNVAKQLGISQVRDHSTYFNGRRRGGRYRSWGSWY